MRNVDIVIACSNGRNRSRILKQHLLELGYQAHAIAATDKSTIATRRVRLAKIVIAVHSEIETLLSETHDLEGKVTICLDVEEMTASTPQGRKLDGKTWLDYQKNHMEPELKRQIKKHLRVLERHLDRTTA